MTNQRRESRHECSLAIELTIDGERQRGVTVNISQGGALVMSVPYPGIDDHIVLHIRLPGVPDVCDIPAVVRWVSEGVGVGLQFERLRPIEVWGFNKLIRDARS